MEEFDGNLGQLSLFDEQARELDHKSRHEAEQYFMV